MSDPIRYALLYLDQGDVLGAKKILRAALASPVQANVPDWKQAVDDALVTCLQCTTDSYTDPKKAINDLICWNIAVATDPRVNGGFQLVPINPTQSMLDANGRSEFPEGKEWLERDARATWAAMLAAAPRSMETGR